MKKGFEQSAGQKGSGKEAVVPKKHWGQNFLVNQAVAQKIAKASAAAGPCGVIEIGPAYGALTKELAQVFDKVVAIEIDKELVVKLRQNLEAEGIANTKIVVGDVLKQDLKKLVDDEFAGLNVVVAANLPYYITTPIITKLMELKLGLEAITVMVQKEVAARLCAEPGTRACGAISYMLRYFSCPQRLFLVGRGNFWPVPNVDSAVVRFEMLKTPPVNLQSEELFFSLIRESFKKRRKTLLNSLGGAIKLGKAELEAVFKAAGVSGKERPEQLTLGDFARIANVLAGQTKG